MLVRYKWFCTPVLYISVCSNHGPFKCPGCDNVTFSNRRSLDMHMKRLHKAGIVECDECGRKVLDLKRHKEILHKSVKTLRLIILLILFCCFQEI